MARRVQSRVIVVISVFVFIFFGIVYHTTISDGIARHVPVAWLKKAEEGWDPKAKETVSTLLVNWPPARPLLTMDCIGLR
jgi:hypothetical protein